MKEFLVRWLKFDENNNPIILNQHIAERLNLPIQIVSEGEVTTIPKDVILCDGCNDVNPEFVRCDKEYLLETVCEKCRKTYHKQMEVKNDLP